MFSRKRTVFWFVCLLCVVLLPVASFARNIYLNGVRINGITNQTFTNVKVKVDAKGDVYIYGSQYKVQKKGAKTPPPPPTTPTKTGTVAKKVTPPVTLLPRPSKKYVAVVQRSGTKASGYSLKIIVNGKVARKVSLLAPQDVFDLTPYVKKGVNKVAIEAYKESTTGGTISLMFGIGKFEGGRVFIQKPYVLDYKRKGSESQNYRHIYNLTFQ
ncbi:MAG: hypothetical protein CL920_11105 [Deltaproteobacteria bacterium]|nr:hypothetical protein [Deltaproteobacteria bacterium]